MSPGGRDVASSFADDPGLLGALRALAALGIGGIAVRLIEMGPGEVCGLPSVSDGWKGFRPAHGLGENGGVIAAWEVDEGVIVVQSCKEGLCCGIGAPSLVSLFSEALFCEGDLADMSVAGGVVLNV
jgi:hypothetical protein